MENVKEHVYLAALLHDIGKFYQRADKKLSDKGNELSDYSKRLANDICPVNDHGRFGYQHVIWTNEFFERFKGILDSVPGIRQNIWDNNGTDSIANLACNHHKPQTLLQGIVTLADWWSAGIDRQNPTTLEHENEETNTVNLNWGKDRYKKSPLYSIFNVIKTLHNKTPHGNMAFPLKALSLSFSDNKKTVPHAVKSIEDGYNEARYAKLWAEFCEEFPKLPTDSYKGFTESLTYLLQKYTWCIPSNTNDMSDVSLFDHLKTTAAFAHCFYIHYSTHPEDWSWDNTNKKLHIKDGISPVLLVGGDLSGIQKFIYNISSQKAAVSLKGRSFYLQLLIDSVIDRIVRDPRVNATRGQVVYSSGGKFYMLLPNTKDVKNALSDLDKEFAEFLWKEHHGQLLLNMDYVAFSFKNGFFCFDGHDNENIGQLWKCLAEKLTNKKNQRFKNIILDKYDELFTAQAVSPNDRPCAVTGIEGKCEKLDNKDNKDEAVYVLKSVKNQCNLGNTLKDADYVITYQEDMHPTYLGSKVKCEIEIAHTYSYLFDQNELIDDNAEFRKITSADVSLVKRINNVEFLDARIKGQKTSYGFLFYGGNKQAQTKTAQNKTFEQLAGDTYLGVLRMDVDGLGAIFINGLENESKSFSAYSTLSFLLDYFFSGLLNTIREEFKDDVNILYAGGDDVFAIGRWDQLLKFAERIRNAFREYTGREDISISGGIVMVNAKFPISKAAEMAGDAEDKAKKFTKQGESKDTPPSKNAITIFNESISWENEFDFVKSYANQFTSLCSQWNMPRSILHKIMQFHIMHKEENPAYLWNTAYYLKRFEEGKNKEICDFCDELKNLILTSPQKQRNIELLAISARWAELELRTNN